MKDEVARLFDRFVEVARTRAPPGMVLRLGDHEHFSNSAVQAVLSSLRKWGWKIEVHCRLPHKLYLGRCDSVYEFHLTPPPDLDYVAWTWQVRQRREAVAAPATAIVESESDSEEFSAAPLTPVASPAAPAAPADPVAEDEIDTELSDVSALGE
jgi:hypothetical protein